MNIYTLAFIILCTICQISVASSHGTKQFEAALKINNQQAAQAREAQQREEVAQAMLADEIVNNQKNLVINHREEKKPLSLTTATNRTRSAKKKLF